LKYCATELFLFSRVILYTATHTHTHTRSAPLSTRSQVSHTPTPIIIIIIIINIATLHYADRRYIPIVQVHGHLKLYRKSIFYLLLTSSSSMPPSSFSVYRITSQRPPRYCSLAIRKTVAIKAWNRCLLACGHHCRFSVHERVAHPKKDSFCPTIFLIPPPVKWIDEKRRFFGA
jgi:hypothetical protein